MDKQHKYKHNTTMFRCQTGSPPKVSPEADNEKGALVKVIRNLNHNNTEHPPTYPNSSGTHHPPPPTLPSVYNYP